MKWSRKGKPENEMITDILMLVLLMIALFILIVVL